MNKWIIAALFGAIAGSIYSQKEFRGGIMLGPVVSQISGDGLGGWDKVGFAAGAWVMMPFSEKTGLTIGMKYITKGSRTKRDTLSFNTFAYHLNYIDVPIQFSYRFDRKKASFALNIGPYAGVLLKQKIVSNGYDYEVNPPFVGYDIGIAAGVTWWMGRKAYFDLSTASSILPTRPAPVVVNPGSYYEYGNYNQTLQLMFGLRFGGGKSSEAGGS